MSGGNPFDFAGEAGKAGEPERDRPVDEPAKSPPAKRKSKSRFRCPYCGSTHPPEIVTQTSTGGWILFVLLFFTMCWPFFLFALMIREEIAYCEACGMKLASYLPPLDRDDD